MKIYISGKITGNPNYKAEFKEAEELIRRNGHIAVNPAEIIIDDNNGRALYKGLQELFFCDAIILLSNWEESEGAKIEKDFSEYCDKDVYYLHHGKILWD